MTRWFNELESICDRIVYIDGDEYVKFKDIEELLYKWKRTIGSVSELKDSRMCLEYFVKK